MKYPSVKLMIGIDPGVNTGFAIWEPADKVLTYVVSLTIIAAMNEVRRIVMFPGGEGVMVIWEDARLRKWFGSKGIEALQGAGSIKRDCSIWAEFLGDLSIPNLAVAPKYTMTKLSAEQFNRMTGWADRTNEHGRDAAMLVFGR